MIATVVRADTTTRPLPVNGEIVDVDVPTTYRLPLIGLCDPADEARITGNSVPAAKQPSSTVSPRVAFNSGPNASGALTSTEVKSQATIGTSTVEAAVKLALPATSNGLTAQLLPVVQRGYNLAQRGAFFAARTEFIQVLRRIAQAKDAAAGTNEHSRQLAAGLRAMDEADDFVPQGVQLEAELDVRSVVSSHRTPVLSGHVEEVSPHEAVVLYHRYAQMQLAQAAEEEQAGSMALYGLGKVYARLAERRDDDVQCVRGAMTMYCAALDACPTNNLAANELGVLLCRTGHPAEAVADFERAINVVPSATAYHNLAVAQRQLGLAAQSAANEQESQRLAAIERSTGTLSRRAGIEWISPQEMARIAPPAQMTPTSPTEPVTAARPTAPPRHPWR